MQEILQSASRVWGQMGESLNEPSRVHAMLVHLPIAIGALGLLLLVILLITGGNADTLRWVCFVLYGIGALTAWYASVTGEQALAQISASGATLSESAEQQLSAHQQMAQRTWIVMLVTAFLVALTAIRATAMRTITLLLALLASLISCGWIVVTAHYGDTLVFVHGAGVATSAVVKDREGQRLKVTRSAPSRDPKTAATAEIVKR